MTNTRTTRRTTRTARTTMTGNSMLLFCAALLMCMSCSILAQSDAWSETTTVGEGSGGWEVTIISTDQPEPTTLPEEETTPAIEELETTTPTNSEDGGADTTLSPNEPEPEPETTAQPNVDPPPSGPSGTEEGSGSAVGPSEQESSPSPSEQSSTSSPIEQESSPSPNEQESSSSSPSEQPSSAGPSEELPTTTESETIVPTIAPTPPAAPVFECQTVGLYPHISGDCQRFHNCLVDPLTGELLAFEMVCPPMLAFSPTYGRCVRDVSTCTNDDFTCVRPGRFAGSDNTFYYNCVVGMQGGFHKYIVRCSAGQRFEPLFKRCWRYDWTQLYPGQALEDMDLAAIKREQKEFKMEEKLRLKAAKIAEKEALKQQKLEEKLAKKAAKEQAKKEAKEAKAKKPTSLESAESPELASLEN